MRFSFVAVSAALALSASALNTDSYIVERTFGNGGGKPNTCASNQFSYSSSLTGNCCLPHNPPHQTPPSGKDCGNKDKDGWNWHPRFNCCVPRHPNQPPPGSCQHGWDGQHGCCHQPPPTSTRPHGSGPSGGIRHHPGGGHGGGHGGYGHYRRSTVEQQEEQAMQKKRALDARQARVKRRDWRAQPTPEAAS